MERRLGRIGGLEGCFKDDGVEEPVARRMGLIRYSGDCFDLGFGGSTDGDEYRETGSGGSSDGDERLEGGTGGVLRRLLAPSDKCWMMLDRMDICLVGVLKSASIDRVFVRVSRIGVYENSQKH